jgi:hypothetical protein
LVNGKNTTWLKFFVCFLLCLQRRVFFAVYGKTTLLLGNPDTPIEKSHKKKRVKKKSKTIDVLVQKIGKFRFYVMFATMDMLIYYKPI